MPQIIKMLMGLGQMKTATQSLSDDEVELIAAELEREVTIKHAGDDEAEPESYDDAEEALEAARRSSRSWATSTTARRRCSTRSARRRSSRPRPAGSRSTSAPTRPTIDGRKITFLDTPGHEAFTAMRARGAKVTDIAVLVVAADDGVMPQTRESISHARAADVPIVVAVNKIDLPDANPDRVLAELATEGLQPEEWGGTTQVAQRLGQAGRGARRPAREDPARRRRSSSMLKANPNAEASGPIIESRLDVGRGPVATMLVHRGTLKVGDAIVAGDAWGRVRALYDYRGEKIEQARPGRAGRDPRLRQAAAGRRAGARRRERPPRARAGAAARRAAAPRGAREAVAAAASRSRTCSSSCRQAASQDLNIVLKGDVQGSVEAIVGELDKIDHSEVRVNVIHTGVGGITENDVNLAAASNAMVDRLQRAPLDRGAPARRARRGSRSASTA